MVHELRKIARPFFSRSPSFWVAIGFPAISLAGADQSRLVGHSLQGLSPRSPGAAWHGICGQKITRAPGIPRAGDPWASHWEMWLSIDLFFTRAPSHMVGTGIQTYPEVHGLEPSMAFKQPLSFHVHCVKCLAAINFRSPGCHRKELPANRHVDSCPAFLV